MVLWGFDVEDGAVDGEGFFFGGCVLVVGGCVVVDGAAVVVVFPAGWSTQHRIDGDGHVTSSKTS